jgi:hypothetical protein
MKIILRILIAFGLLLGQAYAQQGAQLPAGTAFGNAGSLRAPAVPVPFSTIVSMGGGGGGGGGSTTANRQDFCLTGITGCSFSFSSGATSVTLSTTPATTNAVTVNFNGVTQAGNTWSLSGNVITFAAAVPSDVKVIDVSWLSTSISVGTVTSVGLSDASSSPIFNITNSPITSAGVLTATLKTQSANTVFSGPGSGSAAQPSFRALVGADLPVPQTAALGGILALSGATSHQWVAYVDTTGTQHLTQPACGDLSNSGTACQVNTGTSGATIPLLNGNNTYSGTSNFTSTFQIAGNTMTMPGLAATLGYFTGAITAGQCLQTSGTVGLVVTTGSACGGSGSSPGGASTNVQFNSGSVFSGNTGFTYDGTSVAGLGTAGSSVGGLKFFNATSGFIELLPPTGALGSAQLTLPDVTDTLAVIGTAQSFTAAETFTKQIIGNMANTVTSASGAVLDDVYVQAATTTVTGTTTINNLRKVGIYQPTFTDSSSVTITNGSTLYVDNAPAAGGSVTITNPWAIRVGAGNVSFLGTANVVGTITSGTWNGTILTGTYGGTGVNNGAKTITIGANLTTTGAGAPTLAFPSSPFTYTFQAASDTIAGLTVRGQAFSGGVEITSYSIGTVSSGTTTIDCGNSPQQYLTNGGAFTLAAPAADGNCLVQLINNGSAGAVTFSGFTAEASHGDALDTTNAHNFTVSVWRVNSTADYRVVAMQ